MTLPNRHSLASSHRRSAEDRIRERAWIQAGLTAGLDAVWLDRVLRGNPSYNLRRIRSVMRLVE